MNTYKHIDLKERYRIQALLKTGLSIPAIADQLGRDPTTIRRELKRGSPNQTPYDPDHSQCRYNTARAYCKSPYKLSSPFMVAYIHEKLHLLWSPEQICGRLFLEHSISLAPMSIYRLIYTQAEHGGDLWTYMRSARKRPKRRKPQKTIRDRIKDRISIHQRPDVVDRGERLGDVEVDTIVGPAHQGALVTITDRVSSFCWIGQAHGKQAWPVAKKIKQLLKPYKAQIHTITSDNGLEFSEHKTVAKSLKADYYFADPYQTNQRSRIEHTNKLIRQFVPKKTDIRFVSSQQCRIIMNQLNNRPRKKLGYKTPNEVFLTPTKIT
jgi:IS30 family transposase